VWLNTVNSMSEIIYLCFTYSKNKINLFDQPIKKENDNGLCSIKVWGVIGGGATQSERNTLQITERERESDSDRGERKTEEKTQQPPPSQWKTKAKGKIFFIFLI
jgi:hypothetical protein